MVSISHDLGSCWDWAYRTMKDLEGAFDMITKLYFKNRIKK